MRSDIQDVDSPSETHAADAAQEATDGTLSVPAKRPRSRGRGGRRRPAPVREGAPAADSLADGTDGVGEATVVASPESSPVSPPDEHAAVGSAPMAEAGPAPVESPPASMEAEGESDAHTPAPARGRRRTTKAAASASPVSVNVVVARGLGRRVDTKLVRQVVERALQKNGWDQPSTIDVLFVSDADMQEINATRRGIDEPTDVLAFPLLDLRPGQGLTQDFFLLPPDTLPHLGDVVISVDRFESQADEAGHSRQRELAFLTVHGVLHILGYDHETDEERRAMRRREEDVLSELGLRRDGG